MKKYITILLLSAILALSGCSANTPKAAGTYQKLEQSQAKKNLDTDQSIILLDVRTPEEFEEAHIPNSLLIPDYDIEKLASEKLPDQDSTIYIYCRSGRRSKIAAEKLIDMGYSKVYDIGGIIDWKYETISVKK